MKDHDHDWLITYKFFFDHKKCVFFKMIEDSLQFEMFLLWRSLVPEQFLNKKEATLFAGVCRTKKYKK